MRQVTVKYEFYDADLNQKKLKREKEKMKCKFLIFDILLKISAIFGSGIFVHGFFSWYTFPIRLKDLEILIMICF